MVREAASLEYTVHGLAAHLRGNDRAYGTAWAAKFVTDHIEDCEKAVTGPESPIPPSVHNALLADLKSCRQALDRRNTFVHSAWTFEPDGPPLWFGVKANREKTVKGRMQIESAESGEPQELARELDRLHSRILAWDIAYFGEPGDEEEGQPPMVSVKR